MITYYHCDPVHPFAIAGRENLIHMLMVNCATNNAVVLPRKHPQQWQQFNPQFIEWMEERGWWNHIHVDCGNNIKPLEQLVQYAAYIMVFVPTLSDATLFKLRWS